VNAAFSPLAIFSTERLLDRSWTLDDAEAAFAIFSDPLVSRITGRPPGSVAVSRERLERWLAHYERLANGLGFWAIVERETGLIVGEVTLQPLGGPLEAGPEVEIAYHLASRFWGKGYATEAAWGALQYGFKRLNLPRIWALVRPDNDASLRVVARLGMRHAGRCPHGGRELEVYCLNRPPADLPAV
jgi:RimJ/RimL family protein N-acetyltransferase